MDKIDGPYYFFKLIQRMRQLLPPWLPAIGLDRHTAMIGITVLDGPASMPALPDAGGVQAALYRPICEVVRANRA